jgi:hypothetical protein
MTGGQLRLDNCGRTAMAVKLGDDISNITSAITLDRTTQAGQYGQISLTGRPVRPAWTGQPGQDKEDRMPGHDSKDRTVGRGEPGIQAMEQDIWDRTGETGQDRTAREDSWDSTARKENRDSMART